MAKQVFKGKIVYGLFTVVISAVLAISTYHLWGVDWNVPIAGYRADSVGLIYTVNNYVRGGSANKIVLCGESFANSFSGALSDYSILVIIAKLLWKMTGSVEKSINILAILNCIFLSLSTFWVCTRLGISALASMISGILYSNLSYFFLCANSVNMTYCNNFYIPVFCYVLIRMMLNENGYENYNIKDALFVSLVMLCVGSNSAYYAFFALIILSFTGVYVFLVCKSVDRILLTILSYIAIGLGIASYVIQDILNKIGYARVVLEMGYGLQALWLVLAILLLWMMSLAMNKLRSILTMEKVFYGIAGLAVLAGAVFIILKRYTNFIGQYEGRTLYAVELGSLQVMRLFVPVVNSMFGIGQSMLVEIADVNNRSAADFTMIGVLAASGVLYSIMNIFSYNNKSGYKNEILRKSGLINCFIIVVSIKGGLSSVIAMFVTTGIRNYNRMCVFIAAFGIISFGILLDKITDKIQNISEDAIRVIAHLGCAVVFILGLCMSISTDYIYNHTFGLNEYKQRKSEYDEWQRFMASVEECVSYNGMILELPIIMDGTYMGELMTEGRAYERNVPAGISKTTCWNLGGSISGALTDILDNGADIETFLTLAGAYGYEGIYVDTLMYHNDSYIQILQRLGQFLGEPFVCNENRRYFYSMADYNQKLHDRYSQKELEDIVGEYYEYSE